MFLALWLAAFQVADRLITEQVDSREAVLFAALDYVTSELVPQQGKPNKRLYQITEAGAQAFSHWLNHAPLEANMVKHPMQLRLFFGESAEPARLAVL